MASLMVEEERQREREREKGEGMKGEELSTIYAHTCTRTELCLSGVCVTEVTVF